MLEIERLANMLKEAGIPFDLPIVEFPKEKEM